MCQIRLPPLRKFLSFSTEEFHVQYNIVGSVKLLYYRFCQKPISNFWQLTYNQIRAICQYQNRFIISQEHEKVTKKLRRKVILKPIKPTTTF